MDLKHCAHRECCSSVVEPLSEISRRLEGALQFLRSLKQQMHVIDLIKSRTKERSHEPIRDWCEQQTSRVLSSIKSPVREEDVPAYLSVMKEKGFKFFAQR